MTHVCLVQRYLNARVFGTAVMVCMCVKYSGNGIHVCLVKR